MDTFEEFDQPIGPEKSSGAIISHAFEMYKGIFLYAFGAIMISIILSFLLSLVLEPLSGMNSAEVAEEMQSSPSTFFSNMWSIPGLKTYYGLSGLTSLLLSPIYVGIIYIANKYNLKEPMSFSDLFIGFRQNFVNILLYALVSSVILGIAALMCFLPLFFVLPFFMLGYPILLFENATFSQALKKSFAIGKENYGTLLGTSILSLLISIAGIFLCGIGIVFTIPFYLIAMYSAYCAYFDRPRTIVSKI